MHAGFVDVRCTSHTAAPEAPDVNTPGARSDEETSPSVNDTESTRPAPQGSNIGNKEPFYGIVGVKAPRQTAWTDGHVEGDAEMSSFSLEALKELDSPERRPISCGRLKRTMQAYTSLCQWAITVGIPSSAVLHPTESDTIESLRVKRDHMKGMIASFLSSGL